MKLKYYFWAIAALLLSFCTVSCVDNAEDDPNGGKDATDKASFALEVIGSLRNASEEHLQLKVDVENYDGLYLVGMVSVDIYNSEMSGSEDEYVRYLTNYVQGAGSDLNQYDNNYVFRGDSSADVQITWTPEYDTDYKFFVYGVNSEGETTTDVEILDYTTEAAPEAVLTLEVTGTSCNDLGATIKVAHGFTSDYVVGVVTKEYYTNTLTNQDKLLPDYVLGQTSILLAETHGADYEDWYKAGNGYIYNGHSEVNLAAYWDLQPETEYIVVCAALTTYATGDSEGTVMTICDTETLVKAEVATDNTEKVVVYPDSGATFTLEIDEVTHYSFSYTIKNNDNVSIFYSDIVPKVLYDGELGGDARKAAKYVFDARFGATDYTDITIYNNVPCFKYDPKLEFVTFYTSVYWTNIKPESEYVAMAFEVDSKGNILSDVSTLVITTDPAPVMNDLTFEVEPVADFSPTNFKINVTPSDESLLYLVGVFDSVVFDPEEGMYINYETGEPKYEAAAGYWIEEVAGWYDPTILDESGNPIVIDLSKVDHIATFQGKEEIDLDITFTAQNIKADYDYTVLVFSINEYNAITSNIHVETIHTPAAEAADLTFTVEQTIAPAPSVYGWGYDGQIVVTPSNPTEPYFYTFVYGALSTTDLYGVETPMTDEEIFANKNIGLMMMGGTFTGTQTYDYQMADFDAEEVHFVVFGYKDGGMTTKMHKIKMEK